LLAHYLGQAFGKNFSQMKRFSRGPVVDLAAARHAAGYDKGAFLALFNGGEQLKSPNFHGKIVVFRLVAK